MKVHAHPPISTPTLPKLGIFASVAKNSGASLILANRVGADDDITFCGTSAIIDPYGAIVAAASVDREELIQAEIFHILA